MVEASSSDPSLYHNLLKLSNEFNQHQSAEGGGGGGGTTQLSTYDFLEERLSHLRETEIRHFANYKNHEAFLSLTIEDFCVYAKLPAKSLNRNEYKLCVYLIVFGAPEIIGCDSLLKILRNIRVQVAVKLLRYLTVNEPAIESVLMPIGCRLFENEYVVKNLIQPLHRSQRILLEALDALEREQTQSTKKPTTVPVTLNVLKRKPKEATVTPPNAAPAYQTVKSTPVPKSLYQRNSQLDVKLTEEHQKNRENARKLLDSSRSLTVRYQSKQDHGIPSVNKTDVEPPPIIKFRATKVPSQTNAIVAIKDNLTTLLRQAKVCLSQDQQQPEKSLPHNGGLIDDEIEMKHLKGLLTFEEAVLAKQKLKQDRVAHAADLKRERDKLLEEQKLRRAEEQLLLHEIVENTRKLSVDAVKLSEQRIVERKQEIAQQVKAESQLLWHQHSQQEQQEWEQKSKLIEEIKALEKRRRRRKHTGNATGHSTKINHQHNKTGGGLLTDMTSQELRDQLALMKREEEDLLAAKKGTIQRRKEHRQQTIEGIRHTIAQCRRRHQKLTMMVPTPDPHSQPPPSSSPDLMDLRRQLEFARKMRLNNNTT